MKHIFLAVTGNVHKKTSFVIGQNSTKFHMVRKEVELKLYQNLMKGN